MIWTVSFSTEGGSTLLLPSAQAPAWWFVVPEAPETPVLPPLEMNGKKFEMNGEKFEMNGKKFEMNGEKVRAGRGCSPPDKL